MMHHYGVTDGIVPVSLLTAWDAGGDYAIVPRDTCDAFHLLNTTGKWALSACPFAQRMLVLWKTLEHCFKLGQGRHICRATSKFLNMKFLVPKTPAGNRKWGYMTGVPHRYLQNFEVYHYAMIVRFNHALHRNQNFQKEQVRAADMVIMSLLTWTVGFHVGLANHVKELVLELQDPADLPWVRHAALTQTSKHILAMCDEMIWWRRFFHVVFHLTGYVDNKSIRRMTFAFGTGSWTSLVMHDKARKLSDCLARSSHAGRRVCDTSSGIHFGLHMCQMLFTGQYKGIAMEAPCVPLPATEVLLKPSCQCCHRVSPPVSLLARWVINTCYRSPALLDSRMSPIQTN